MQGNNRTMVNIGEKISSFKHKHAFWEEKLSQEKSVLKQSIEIVLMLNTILCYMHFQ
jgi:hypothetical protein